MPAGGEQAARAQIYRRKVKGMKGVVSRVKDRGLIHCKNILVTSYYSYYLSCMCVVYTS